VELGCGTGALTRILHRRYPNMLAVDVDPRAIEFVKDKIPSLTAVQSDVLQVSHVMSCHDDLLPSIIT